MTQGRKGVAVIFRELGNTGAVSHWESCTVCLLRFSVRRVHCERKVSVHENKMPIIYTMG